MRATFHIPGTPAAQGSKRHVGKGIMVEMNRNLAPWRLDVFHVAQAHWGDKPTRHPIRLVVNFLYERPKAHYGSGRNAELVKASAPIHKVTKPDLDKLARAILDGLTGAVYVDDSQVMSLTVTKRYAGEGETPGAYIDVEDLR